MQTIIDEMHKIMKICYANIYEHLFFSLQLDDSILPGNESLIFANVRYIKEEKNLPRIALCSEFRNKL